MVGRSWVCYWTILSFGVIYGYVHWCIVSYIFTVNCPHMIYLSSVSFEHMLCRHEIGWNQGINFWRTSRTLHVKEYLIVPKYVYLYWVHIMPLCCNYYCRNCQRLQPTRLFCKFFCLKTCYLYGMRISSLLKNVVFLPTFVDWINYSEFMIKNFIVEDVYGVTK